MSASTKNENYTKLGEFLKERIEESVNEISALFLTRESVRMLTDEFCAEAYDVRADIEKKIIRKLVIGDSFTNYVSENGKRPVCDYDRGDDSEVEKVAEKYRAYAKKLPSAKDICADGSDVFGQKITGLLNEILDGCKSSADYIARLVRQRIKALNNDLERAGDSVRLLIFKQALLSLGFPGKGYFSNELTKYICDIAGIGEKASAGDVKKAISTLTDDVFAKLDENESIINEAKKHYDDILSVCAEVNAQYRNTKKECKSADRMLKKEEKASKKEEEKAKKAYERAKSKLEKLRKAINRDEALAKKATEADAEKYRKRIADSVRELAEAESEYEKASDVYDKALKRTEKAESERNSADGRYNTLNREYEALKVKKEELSKSKKRAKNRYKDLQDALNKKWEPLIWADNLGCGYFNDQQTTRKKLYWFAIIFEMTFCRDGNESTASDIEKKLFYDYYADNLLNNLLVTDTKELKKIEKEPTGHGINYKNYVEVIYLYYIAQRDMSPLEKLLAAEEMIELCKCNDRDAVEKQIMRHGDSDTRLYQSKFGELLEIDAANKNSLWNYIKANYIRGAVPKSATESDEESETKDELNSVPIRVASENKRATRIYAGLVDGLEREVIRINRDEEEIKLRGHVDEKMDYKSIATRQMIILSELVRDTLSRVGDGALKSLLTRIDEKFRCVWRKKEAEECVGSTFMPGGNASESVSRTGIIILYYYLVGLQYFEEGVYFDDFGEFYEDFCEKREIEAVCLDEESGDDMFCMGLNECLEAAGYQKINPKNIFDITVLLFAYKKFMYMPENDKEDK